MATALIETPNSSTDPSDLVTEEIFVPDIPPPGETPAAAPTSASATTSVSSRPPVQPREVEELDFAIDGEADPFRVVPLKHPFRRAGMVIREIAVRRLTVGQVGDLIDARPAGLPDFFDIYAVMTGFPAPVLRGLIDVDGEAVAGACFDFLPRYYRPGSMAPDASSSTFDGGAVS